MVPTWRAWAYLGSAWTWLAELQKGTMDNRCVLCQGFTLSLQQVVTSLGALELAFHHTQRLPCREDGLSGLRVVLASAVPVAHDTDSGSCTYPAARHICSSYRWWRCLWGWKQMWTLAVFRKWCGRCLGASTRAHSTAVNPAERDAAMPGELSETSPCTRACQLCEVGRPAARR